MANGGSSIPHEMSTLPMVIFYQTVLFIHPQQPARAQKVQFDKNDSSVRFHEKETVI